ncbi:hypothetical protein NIES4071_20750 [Calothrix sp. NIES-4071]|nr:hypothetical protein NIES4071_20750 [Calothrix sp. NIES-4071]BAZ56407.1 hypothetical protein NIES4105_20700 [Calothrix sp. NIES-4105]
MINDFLARWTPEELTCLFRLHGHLKTGNILKIEVTKTFETPPSNLANLTLTYSPDVSCSEVVKHLLLKAPKPHKLMRGKREIDFYTKVAPLIPNVPVVPCFATSYEEKTGISYLFLADVSATHATREREILSPSQLESMIDALAQLHATLWDYPNLLSLAGESPRECLGYENGDNEEDYAGLVAQLGEQLTADERKIFEIFLTDAPKLLLERAESGQHLTLCHPENHHGNFLLPYQDEACTYIIDWHQYRYWWGARDIVSLVNRCLLQEQLHLTESLLLLYYERLLKYGVTNYAWSDCLSDYRLGIIDYLTLPLQYQEAYKKYPEFFMRMYRGIMHEFHKWECASILF